MHFLHISWLPLPSAFSCLLLFTLAAPGFNSLLLSFPLFFCLLNLLRANVNSGTCSQVRLATGYTGSESWPCYESWPCSESCSESCPKMNECLPRPVGNKNVVVAKQRRGYSPWQCPSPSLRPLANVCLCCTQLHLVCNALSIDKVSTRYR